MKNIVPVEENWLTLSENAHKYQTDFESRFLGNEGVHQMLVKSLPVQCLARINVFVPVYVSLCTYSCE